MIISEQALDRDTVQVLDILYLGRAINTFFVHEHVMEEQMRTKKKCSSKVSRLAKLRRGWQADFGCCGHPTALLSPPQTD